jgi:hypothetical protein
VVRATALVLVAVLAGGCGASAERSRSTAAPLTVFRAPLPPIRELGYETRGAVAQVTRRGIDLRAVNSAIRAAVRSDEGGGGAAYGRGGFYSAGIDPRLISASTLVFSAMLPTVDFNGSQSGFGWVSLTRRVPSGKPVTLSELFADPFRGGQIFSKAWRGQLRPGARGCVARDYVGDYGPGLSYFTDFALTPAGLAAGPTLDGACNGILATVRWATLRPYLGRLGTQLLAGIRRPRFSKMAAGSREPAVVSVQVLPYPNSLPLNPRGLNRMTVRRPIRFKVTVDAEGRKRSNIRVALAFHQDGSKTTRRETIESIPRGHERSVIFPKLSPAFGVKALVEVELTVRRDEMQRLDSVGYLVEFFSFPRPCPLVKPRCG